MRVITQVEPDTEARYSAVGLMRCPECSFFFMPRASDHPDDWPCCGRECADRSKARLR